jgi:hypothetical protein
MQTAQQLVKDGNSFFIRDRDHYENLVSISRRIADKNLQGTSFLRFSPDLLRVCITWSWLP